MPSIDAVVACPLYDSFRVQQVAGMFGLSLEERLVEEFSVEIPAETEPWQVGLIVGPSGSGKSTVARQAFGERLVHRAAWPEKCAVIDALGTSSTREAIRLLTSVGLSSPPAWIRPYATLSCGEQFRCDLARALSTALSEAMPGATLADRSGCTELPHKADTLRPEGCQRESANDRPQEQVDEPRASGLPIVAMDEFTSVVDRQVARACAVAVSQAVRRGLAQCRFVAVTCHYDIAAWLEADWVLDMASGRLARRRLRRPSIRLEIGRCGLAAWPLFARHHYLSGALASSAQCFLATWEGQPVTFCATLPMMARRRHRRFTRIVTLPDYQGMGIGTRVVEAVADLYRGQGMRINVTTGHPTLLRHCQRSSSWRVVDIKKNGSRVRASSFGPHRSSAGRAVVSFEYL